ncbi:MAG: nitrous oxide-stimulated promoter family protein [Xanthomonadales bacterium]|nr:nitrous oxide-stimulated promoter family protein [Gammaproteobacteria bacterium]MBT8055114.1 nitrous oxide-stimulated promoter family protein [Gammaproteobacteria bacterium]NND58397.1 nitrous oxide-stimulated promoter family protein [Xanthomonadales bacterium]NNK51708.1 nitrous oxide-stimulated promoter family protein [Xanthomonadales bacterium]
MSKLKGRLRREHETLVCMTRIYCEHHHSSHDGAGLCPECNRLMQYAGRRLEKCPYGEQKPTCANCPIHCYKPAQRQMARDVMLFAGPRMPWRHPLRALNHLLDKLRRVEHPMKMRNELRRRQKAADKADTG